MYHVHILDTSERYICGADRTLLSGMEALGRRGIPVGCRGGGCGVCKVRVCRGVYAAQKMSRACVSAEEQASGVVLACRAYPASDIELQVVGRLFNGLRRHSTVPSPVLPVSGSPAFTNSIRGYKSWPSPA